MRTNEHEFGWGADTSAYYVPRLSRRVLESRRDSVTQPRVASPRATLGTWHERHSTLNGLKPERCITPKGTGWNRAATLSGLKGFWNSAPRVASQTRQPWADGHNPFGIGSSTSGGTGLCQL